MKGGKIPIKDEHPHKIIGLVALAIDGEVNLKAMKVVDQEQVVTILKKLHHMKWWQVQDVLLIRRVTINITYENT